MLMLSFGFVIVSGLFEWKHICSGFIMFVYICIDVRDPIIQRKRVGVPLTGDMLLPEFPTSGDMVFSMFS
jgi:hypothetical protein